MNKTMWIRIGQAYWLKHERFKDFDKKKLHSKLVFDIKSYRVILLPGTSKKPINKCYIEIPSKEFSQYSSKDITYFIYNIRRTVSIGDILKNGELWGGPTPKILEEINKFKRKKGIKIKDNRQKNEQRDSNITAKLGEFFQRKQ